LDSSPTSMLSSFSSLSTVSALSLATPFSIHRPP
jgi:hypothetical protein